MPIINKSTNKTNLPQQKPPTTQATLGGVPASLSSMRRQSHNIMNEQNSSQAIINTTMQPSTISSIIQSLMQESELSIQADLQRILTGASFTDIGHPVRPENMTQEEERFNDLQFMERLHNMPPPTSVESIRNLPPQYNEKLPSYEEVTKGLLKKK